MEEKMTKEVTVTIEGYQLDTEEEPMISKAVGTYHLHKDMHFISYEEPSEEGTEMIRSRIRMSQAQVEMTRTGAASAVMSFEENRSTEAVYRTAYGELCFEIKTSRITFRETSSILEAGLEYSLFSSGTCISKHRTVIRVMPR
jgi:uncharacterized beta-barrel protein YwiB (DUF1934 family)